MCMHTQVPGRSPQPPASGWMHRVCLCPRGCPCPGLCRGGAVPAPLPQQRHRPRSLPPSSPSRRRSRTETQKAAGAGPRRHHDGDHQDPRYPAGLRQLQPHHQGPHPDVRSVPGRGLFRRRTSRGVPGERGPGRALSAAGGAESAAGGGGTRPSAPRLASSRGLCFPSDNGLPPLHSPCQTCSLK